MAHGNPKLLTTTSQKLSLAMVYGVPIYLQTNKKVYGNLSSEDLHLQLVHSSLPLFYRSESEI